MSYVNYLNKCLKKTMSFRKICINKVIMCNVKSITIETFIRKLAKVKIIC